MRRLIDMDEVASVLDDTIAKSVTQPATMDIDELVSAHKKRPAFTKSRRHRQSLMAKSLSFNPLEPVPMTADSSYYNPYRQLEDGSFAPHASGYWLDQNRMIDVPTEVRLDAYREVDAFYLAAGGKTAPVMKAVLEVEIEQVLKGMGAGVPGQPAPMSDEERIAKIKHHIKRNKAKEKLEKEKQLDDKVQSAVDQTLAGHFETMRIQTKVNTVMGKRLGAMGPQQHSQLHSAASGMMRPPTPDETSWSRTSAKAKKPKPAPEGFA